MGAARGRQRSGRTVGERTRPRRSHVGRLRQIPQFRQQGSEIPRHIHDPQDQTIGVLGIVDEQVVEPFPGSAGLACTATRWPAPTWSVLERLIVSMLPRPETFSMSPMARASERSGAEQQHCPVAGTKRGVR